MKDLKVIVLSDEEYADEQPLLIMNKSQREELRPFLNILLVIMEEEESRLDDHEYSTLIDHEGG